jgi:hypothetical protein
MKKLFAIFTILILFTPLTYAKACYYKQYSPLHGKIISIPCEEPSKYRKKRVEGPVYDMYGRMLGTKIKGAKLVAYDKKGHRVGYYRRVGNKILKYDRSGKMIATYSANNIR